MNDLFEFERIMKSISNKPAPVGIILSPETIAAMQPIILNVDGKPADLTSKFRFYNGLKVIRSDAIKLGKFLLLDAEGRVIWDY